MGNICRQCKHAPSSVLLFARIGEPDHLSRATELPDSQYFGASSS